MPSFALICEGITDQAAIESILTGYYADPNIIINPLQPSRDLTDLARQSSFGGWEQVIEHCQNSAFVLEALNFNDYLIIQLDTDTADGHRLPLQCAAPDGTPKSDTALIAEAEDYLKSLLGVDITSIHGHQIIFAICIHSLECWLLPIYSTNKSDRNRTVNCEQHLNRSLRRKDLHYEKTYRCYTALCKHYEKRKFLEAIRPNCSSLSHFLEHLPPPVP